MWQPADHSTVEGYVSLEERGYGPAVIKGPSSAHGAWSREAYSGLRLSVPSVASFGF